MKHIPGVIQAQPGFASLLSRLEQSGEQSPLGLSRAARLPVLAALHQATGRPLLLITQKSDRALTLADELALWAPQATRLYFPEPTSLFYENVPWGENTRRERILALTTLAAAMIPGAPQPPTPPIVVAPARALMARILPRREFLKAARTLRPGQQVEPVALAHTLAANGYEATDTVVLPGQFARRGGLLDLWPVAEQLPTRLDFFGDEIESMRGFEPATQRSHGEIEKLLVPPAREFLVDPEAALPDDELGWTEFHIPLLHKAPASMLDYLPQNALVLMDDWEAFRGTMDDLESQAVSLHQDYLADGSIGEDYPLPYLTLAEIEDSLSRRQTLELGPSGLPDASELASYFTPNPRFGGQLNPLVDHLQRVLSHGDEAVVVSRQAVRLQELWQQQDEVGGEAPRFHSGSLAEGWMLSPPSGARLHLLSDGEIFGWKRPQPRQRPRLVTEPPEHPYNEFQPGDLLVHVDYGIGRYIGLVERMLEGHEQEYLSLEYANGDLLYVPVHQVDRLTRYVGARGQRPSISRLGGTEWQSIKARVKQAVQEVAEDMLALYAKRQMAEGHAFNADTPWQKELEASFPYIETEDQLRVLSEVKTDMQQPRPMDRLICGDVGYGKTEVALRAAFKAVMDGKQVAMLVPTTVLAQQHFRTFRQRLAPFPVQLEMLSRFRGPTEQREIIHQLAEGALDIVIGTHRLLQSDVQFKDLGLVIIDEEQRFGVTHKEYLKQLRTEVDVLTLTATPIPRTLYMALTGVRDISTINTPPEERLPIVTHVGPYSPKLVRQAILRELERGGQVFFVHNRVQTIDSMQARVAQLVPEARIAIAHGQMNEKQLATRMRQFSNGEIDVLLSTSIIESGLDIPNANTLIVDRADTFGLAQLYQLRGRVGRGAARAYAYFFKHRTRVASEVADMRLETLAENTQLGAGFSIAMRDLEIRGAGDFLGTRQHGHIAAIGLNLYTRLLNQAVGQLKNEGQIRTDSVASAIVSYHPFVNIDLPLAANIPPEYVPEKELRLRLYRRLADIHAEKEIEAVQAEFADRFGSLPQETENLLYQLRVKVLAEHSGLTSIGVEGEQIVLRFPATPEGAPKRQLPPLGREVFGSSDTLRFHLQEGWQSQLVTVLGALRDGKTS